MTGGTYYAAWKGTVLEPGPKNSWAVFHNSTEKKKREKRGG